MTYARATVTAVGDVNPRFRRIDFSVPDLADLRLPDVGDAAVGVYPPSVGQRHAVDFADAIATPQGRNYTVRRHDPGTTRLSLDVVLHAGGLVADWARRAVRGDSVLLGHGRSWYAPPVDADWQLLVADLSGLPALARILAESPSDASLVAIVEVIDESDLHYLAAPAHAEVITAVGSGNGAAESKLSSLAAGRDLPTGRGYCWFAGEAGEARTVRKRLRARGWTTDQFDVVGYWRRDSPAWDRRFAAVSNEVVAVYTAALAAGHGEKIASERFDEALEEAGL